MAISEFYMTGTGSNLNAGSTTADSAVYTSTSGDWDGTSVFTPNDGSTPASSIAANDWVSIYPDGNSTTPYIVQVTSVAAGVNGAITCSTTKKFGTAPTTSSGTHNRSLKAGGAWANLGMTASGVALNTGTVTQSTRINVKAQTDANTTTSRTIALAGAPTTPLIWDGYKVNPQDMDGQPTSTRTAGTDIPSWTFTTGQLTISGVHSIFANIDIQSQCTTSGGAVNATGGNLHFHRVRINNTAANTAARALTAQTNGNIRFTCCWFQGTSTATNLVNTSQQCAFIGCTFRAGGASSTLEVGSDVVVIGCTFDTCTAIAINLNNTGRAIIVGNTFSNVVTDAIKIPLIPGNLFIIWGNIYSGCAKGINNSSGAAGNIIMGGFDYFNNTSNLTNTGDWPVWSAQQESASPFANASGHDLTLISSALARANGVPGLFENESYFNYQDIGAVQRQEVTLVSPQVTIHQDVYG